MGLIARESIEEVRRANDIVELISGYVPLKKRGASHWACCPFHDEKTPSFTVSGTRQTYKCFGCGEFGNAIDFVMKHEKLDFREAAEKLASRGGVTLHFEGGGPSVEQRSQRQKALEIMAWAQKGFAANLGRNKAALDYVESRGLGGEIAESWGLGYAPDGGHRLTDAARQKFPEDALLATGLSRRGDDGRWYDFFRGRLTFPIRDAQSRIVGFGARLLDPNVKAQKYVNSAEGVLFQKSRLLYAIDRLSDSKRLKHTGQALVMEGYTDVIMAHAHGFDNAVAPLGTALTREQLSLMRRYTSKLMLVLDGDAAGVKAAERAVDLVLEAGMDGDVAVLPDAMDPFDLLRVGGTEAFEASLKQSRSVFAFKLETLAKRHNLKNPAEAEKAVAELAEALAHAESPTLREKYAREAHNTLGISEAKILGSIEFARRQLETQLERQAKAATASAGGAKSDLPLGNGTVGGIGYERELLCRLFEQPSVMQRAAGMIAPQDFQSPALQEVYREILNALDEGGEAVPGALLSHLGQGARAELDRIVGLMGLPANLSAGEGAEEAAKLETELRHFARHRREGAEPAAAKGSSAELEALRKKKATRRGRAA